MAPSRAAKKSFGRTAAVALAAGGMLVSITLPAAAAPVSSSVAQTGTLAAPTVVDAAFGSTVPAPVIAAASRSTAANPAVASAVFVAETVAAPVVAPVVAPPVVPLGQRVLEVADDYAGVPYVYGGTTPSGFDCSGYTGYVYAQLGFALPRTANAQLGASQRISREQAVPGDLVFFTSSSGRAYHVGIYAGGNQMWDAPRAGKTIQLRDIWSSAVTFGRVAPVV